jgi:UPF0755 protein
VKLLAYLLAGALLVAALAAYLLLAPFAPPRETFVDIPPGTATPKIASQLEAAGIIRSRFAFDLLRLTRGGRLQAGEYRFDHPVAPAEVYRRIARGDVYTRSLVIPEGFNIFDIAEAVEAAGLGSRTTFLAAERSETDLIAPWLPRGGARLESLEGFLFPDTYHFSRHATPEQMLAAMVRRFHQAATKIGLMGSQIGLANTQPSLTNDLRHTLTLASIIEKEVREPAERPLVAGVFENRLKLGMPLQTDPTVIYAALLNGTYRGTIYASDLQSPSPYNTYRHPGLPPGPICNPGLASLVAAMHPTKTAYLYFVSDASGHSRFTASLGEHGRNVQAYRSARIQP